MRFDIAIVGAGPGGCAAAITASRGGARVLLIDKDEFPRHKVCGEFASFESLQLLQVLLNEEVSGFLGIRDVRLFRGHAVRHGRLGLPALSIPRYELDRRLLEVARATGAMIVTG